MARPKKYNISLTDDELKELKSVMRKKQTTKTVRNRCQIIIDLDEAHGKVLTQYCKALFRKRHPGYPYNEPECQF